MWNYASESAEEQFEEWTEVDMHKNSPVQQIENINESIKMMKELQMEHKPRPWRREGLRLELGKLPM